MVHVVIHGDGVEVGAHAGIRHVIQEREGVGSGVHAAEGVAVGEAVRRRLLALLEGDVLGDGDGDGGVVHLLVLTQRALVLGLAREVGGLEGGGVEHAGDLVDAAEHAAEGQSDLIAGHDILVPVAGVLRGDGDLGHAHQTIADAAAVGHAEDDGTAHAVAQPVEVGQGHGIAAILTGGDAPEGGNGALHRVVGGDKGVLHLDAAAALHYAEGQGGIRLAGLVVPGVVVVVPIHGAGGGSAGGHVEVHIRIGGAVGHNRTAHYDDAHTMGLGGGVQTAVAAVALGVHVHAVIVDGDDGILRAGGNIRPVGGGVAAVHRLDLRVAGGQIPVEVRLHHDVAGIGVDELPVTVGPDAGGAVQHLEAAGIQVHLQVGLVALGGLGAQLAEIVGQAIRGGVITEGEGHVLAGVEAGQPAACVTWASSLRRHV